MIPNCTSCRKPLTPIDDHGRYVCTNDDCPSKEVDREMAKLDAELGIRGRYTMFGRVIDAEDDWPFD